VQGFKEVPMGFGMTDFFLKEGSECFFWKPAFLLIIDLTFFKNVATIQK
jgi:hypothetical protein